MKISHGRGLEEDGAKFWLSRVGRKPSEALEKIAQENDLEKKIILLMLAEVMDAMPLGLLNNVFTRF